MLENGGGAQGGPRLCIKWANFGYTPRREYFFLIER